MGGIAMNRAAGYNEASLGAPKGPLPPLAPLRPVNPATADLQALPSLKQRNGLLKPATLYTPEQEAKAKEVFASFDANKNGKIEKSELSKMLSELTKLDGEMLTTVINESFNRGDRDMS